MSTLLMLLAIAFQNGITVSIEAPSPTGYYACDAFVHSDATIVVCMPDATHATLHIHPNDAPNNAGGTLQ